MEAKILFRGGPMSGQVAYTDKLTETKVFFDDPQKVALVYARENEVEYVYDFIKSKALTTNYQQARDNILQLPKATLRLTQEKFAADTFSETPIVGPNEEQP